MKIYAADVLIVQCNSKKGIKKLKKRREMIEVNAEGNRNSEEMVKIKFGEGMKAMAKKVAIARQLH